MPSTHTQSPLVPCMCPWPCTLRVGGCSPSTRGQTPRCWDPSGSTSPSLGHQHTQPRAGGIHRGGNPGQSRHMARETVAEVRFQRPKKERAPSRSQADPRFRAAQGSAWSGWGWRPVRACSFCPAFHSLLGDERPPRGAGRLGKPTGP